MAWISSRSVRVSRSTGQLVATAASPRRRLGAHDDVGPGAVHDREQLALLGRGDGELVERLPEVGQHRVPFPGGDVEMRVSRLHVATDVAAGTTGRLAHQGGDVELQPLL